MSVKPTQKPISQFRRNKLALALLATFPLASLQALADQNISFKYSSGEVIKGDVTFSSEENIHIIEQKTEKILIQWEDFNIDTGHKLQFNQPGQNSIALNQIVGNNPSQILGTLEANGRVILVNPNGIVFEEGSVINVGGLVASGLSLDENVSFIDDSKISFYLDDTSSGHVINQGSISASIGGVSLIGKYVNNEKVDGYNQSGSITSHLGKVSLIAGKDAVLTFDNNGIIGIKIKESNWPESSDLIDNNSEIQQGFLLLDGRTTRDIFSDAVNHEGYEKNLSVTVLDAENFILGGVQNTGSIDVSYDNLSPELENINILNPNSSAGGDIIIIADSSASISGSLITKGNESFSKNGRVSITVGDNLFTGDKDILNIDGSAGSWNVGAKTISINSNNNNHNHEQNSNGNLTINWNAINSGLSESANITLTTYIPINNDIDIDNIGNIDIEGFDISGGGSLSFNAAKNISIKPESTNQEINNSSTNIFFTAGLQQSELNDSGFIVFDKENSLTINTAGGSFFINANDVDMSGLDLFTDGGNVTIISKENIKLGSINTLVKNKELTLSNVNESDSYTGNLNLINNNLTGVISQKNSLKIEGSTLIDFSGGNVSLINSNNQFKSGLLAKVVNGELSLTTDKSLKILNSSDGLSGITAKSINLSISGDNNIRSILDIEGDLNVGKSDSAVINLNGYVDIFLSNNDNYSSDIRIEGLVPQESDVSRSYNSLKAQNKENYWSTNNDNQGVITGAGNSRVYFKNINRLIGGDNTNNFDITHSLNADIFGGDGDDSFVLTYAGSVTSIDGGKGENFLTGLDGNNTWRIGAISSLNISANDFSLEKSYVESFTNIQHLVGGSGDDSFIIGANSSVLSIDGGGTANNEVNTLMGANNKNTWSITGTANSLNATEKVEGVDKVYVAAFTNINALVAGSEGDTFNIDAEFKGSIDGGIGNDIFNLNANVTQGVQGNEGDDTFNINANLKGALLGGAGNDRFIIGQHGSASSIAGGDGTDSLQGGNTTNTWSITDTKNSLIDSDTNTIIYVGDFKEIDKLIGGSDVDTFNINAAFTGDIEGGAGNDVFEINQKVTGAVKGNGESELAAGFTDNDYFIIGTNGSVELIDGGEGTNSLQGRNVTNNWVISANANWLSTDDQETNAYVNSFTGINKLVGGSDVDTFNITAAFTGDIEGGAGDDIFEINQKVTGTVKGNGGSELAEGFTDNDHFIIGTTGSALSIDGGEGNDTLQGSDGKNAWSITSEGTSLTVSVDSSNSYVTKFTGIDKLVGGSEVDTFNITAAFTGDIEGGAGNDVFEINQKVTGTVKGNGGSELAEGFTDNDHFIIGTTGSASLIDGGEGNDTLQGSDGKNAWSITSEGKSLTVNVDSSNSYVTAFTGINKLIGGSNIDTFNITAAFTGDIEGGAGNDHFIIGTEGSASLIDGGEGNDTLQGSDGKNAWSITSEGKSLTVNVDSSNSYVTAFTGINKLIGGSNADTFNINAAFTGDIEGGAGNDHFIIGTEGSASLIDGGEGNDTLQGSDGKNAWSITSEGKSLTVNVDSSNSYVTAFTGINKLIGGSNIDTFNITAAFTGDIEGGAGNDVFEINQKVTGILSGGAGDDRFIIGQNGSANSIVGGEGTDSLQGGNTTNTWLIADKKNSLIDSDTNTNTNTNINTNTIVYVGDFTGIDKLIGGSNVDTFNITAAFTGDIEGGAGNDHFIIGTEGSASLIDGGEGNDTLQGSDGKNAWSITSEGKSLTVNVDSSNSYVTAFTGINKLIGGSNADTFNINAAFTGDIEGGAGDDVFIIGANGFVGSIDGGEGKDTLKGSDNDSTWLISGINNSLGEKDNETALYVNEFTGIEKLVGGSANDNFIFSSTGTTPWIVDGGLGTDNIDIQQIGQAVEVSLDEDIHANFWIKNINNIEANKEFDNKIIATNADNLWSITNRNEGDVNEINFVNFSILQGGSEVDQVIYRGDNARITGSIDFGGGVDTFDTSDSKQEHKFYLGDHGESNTGVRILNLENIIGSGESTYLYAGDVANDWVINQKNSGTLNSNNKLITFTGVDNLVGGSHDDLFVFDTLGDITGRVDGGLHITKDIVDVTRSTIAIHLASNQAKGFTNIEHYSGNSTTTTFYADNTNNQWDLTGVNSGSINGISFTGMSTLIGGNKKDIFRLKNATITNSIQGRDGDDDFIIESSTVSQGVYGNEGDDTFTVTIANANSLFKVYGGAGENEINLIGGASEAIIDHRVGQFDYKFPYETKTSIYFEDISKIDDSVLGKEMNVYSHTNHDQFKFTNARYQLGNNPVVTYSNKNSLFVHAKNDDTITINGSVNFFDEVTFNNGTINYQSGEVKANTIRFANTKSIGSNNSPLVINANNIMLHNSSGSVDINALSDVNIIEMVTTGKSNINLLSNGNINSSSAIYHQGDLFLTSTLGNITLNRNNQLGGKINLQALYNIELNNNFDIDLGYLNSQSAKISTKGSLVADAQSQIINTNNLDILAEVDINLLNPNNSWSVLSARGKNINLHENDGFIAQGIYALGDLSINTNGTLELNNCTTCELPGITANKLSIDSGAGIIYQNTDIDIINDYSVQSNGLRLSGKVAAGRVLIDTKSGDLLVSSNATISSNKDISIKTFKLSQLGNIYAQDDITIDAVDDINMASGAVSQTENGSIFLQAQAIGLGLLEARSGEVVTTASKNIFNNGSPFNIITQHWKANAETGIGSNASEDQAIFTNVDELTLSNAGVINSGIRSSISINEKDSVMVNRIANNGDIALRIGVGDILLNKRNNNYYDPSKSDARLQGAVLNANQGELGGTLELYLTNGSILPRFDDHDLDLADSKNPDVMAENAIFYYENREFLGQRNRRMIMSVRNTYDNNAKFSYIRWYNGIPPINNNDTSQKIKDFSLSEQLILIEEVSDIDPAVFTHVRNYIADDIGILLPPDQRFDSDDDEDEEDSYPVRNHLSYHYQ